MSQRRTSFYIWATLSCLIALGCSTPYQPLGYRGGYFDLRLDSETYKVSFRGNGNTSSEKVENYLLFRCAELTAQNGFDYFAIIDSKAENRQAFVTTPGNYSSTTSFYGNTAYTQGRFTPGTTTPINKHVATVVIKVFKGVKPNITGAFNARELINNLRSQVKGLPDDP